MLDIAELRFRMWELEWGSLWPARITENCENPELLSNVCGNIAHAHSRPQEMYGR